MRVNVIPQHVERSKLNAVVVVVCPPPSLDDSSLPKSIQYKNHNNDEIRNEKREEYESKNMAVKTCLVVFG